MIKAFLLFIVGVISTPSSAWGQEGANVGNSNPSIISTVTTIDSDSTVTVFSSNSTSSPELEPEDKINTINTINCSLLGLLPFTVVGQPYKSYQLPLNTTNTNTNTNITIAEAPPYAVTHAAAALLATDHFNARQSMIVPELAKYTTNCSVRINELSFGNTDSREGIAPKFMMDRYKANNGEEPCAVLGGYVSIPTREAAVVANGMNSVVVTHGAEDARLTSIQVPEVTTTGSNYHPMGEAIANWLRSNGRTNFMAVLHTSADHGITYADTLDNAFKESNVTQTMYTIVSPPYIGMEPNSSVRLAMLKIQESTYRTIVAVLNKYQGPQLDLLADLAEEFGMNTDEYVWVFVLPIHQTMDDFVVYSMAGKNSSKLVQGSALIRTLDGAILEGSNFQQAWKEQDESFVERLNEIVPKQYEVSKDYFQQYRPEPGAGYMYDAVMAAAMGRCQEEKAAAAPPKGGEKGTGGKNNNKEGNSNSPNNNKDARRRRLSAKGEQQQQQQKRRKLQKAENLSPHMKGITSLEFTGVTGSLAWTNERRLRNRQRTLMTWGVYNIREIDAERRERMEDHFPNQNFTLWYYLTDILQGGPVEGQWTMTEDGPFLFSDGTSVPSKLLRDDPEQNYLSPSVRIIGLTLMSISLFCSILVTVLVWMNQDNQSIRGNQPIFLYILLTGTFVMAWSILFLSFDESSFNVSAEEDEPRFLDIACTMFPWFLSLGYVLIYGTLFMKLWRINRVLQSCRTRVEAKQVAWPCITLLGIAIIILTIWTAIDPWQWERNPVNDSEPQAESYGQCTSDHDMAFIIILALVMLGATVLAGFMAWKTKDVDTKFSESSWIFTTIVLQFQVLGVGIPILIIVQRASADATYTGRVLLIWTMTMSTLALMFGPKLIPILLPDFADRLSGTTGRSTLASGNVRVSDPRPNYSTGITARSGESGSGDHTSGTAVAELLRSNDSISLGDTGRITKPDSTN